jgi:hypothetical protein
MRSSLDIAPCQRRPKVRSGGVAEWLKAPVLKTGNGQPFVSSNLTASANYILIINKIDTSFDK